ncbi:MAG: amino acid ABC transporter substrate-binding protein, partial [Oscillospiraceae bacterium]
VSTEAAALIIEQISSQNSEIPILAGDTWDSNVILNAAKGKPANVYVTTFYQEGGNAEFDSGIKKWINENPVAKANNGGDDIVSGLTAMGYDAYFTALEAAKLAKSTDSKAINEAIWNVKYKGVSGDIAFENVNGDCIRDVAYVKHANTESGAWEFETVQGVK